jgi:hypothetical protein
MPLLGAASLYSSCNTKSIFIFCCNYWIWNRMGKYDGDPYLMVVANIPKEHGVYMGIINMMIVIPMIFQNVSFGFILKHFLNNDPRLAITFAGVLLLSAICTLFINRK